MKPGTHAKVAVLGKLLPLVVDTVPFAAAARLSHGIPAKSILYEWECGTARRTFAAVGPSEAGTALAREDANSIKTESAVEAGTRCTVKDVAGSGSGSMKLAAAPAPSQWSCRHATEKHLQPSIMAAASTQVALLGHSESCAQLLSATAGDKA